MSIKTAIQFRQQIIANKKTRINFEKKKLICDIKIIKYLEKKTNCKNIFWHKNWVLLKKQDFFCLKKQFNFVKILIIGIKEFDNKRK